MAVIEELKRRRYGSALADQIPDSQAQDLPPGSPVPAQVNSTELGRNVSNALAAIPGAGPTLGAIRGLAGASSTLPSASGIVSRLANLTAPVAPYAPVAGGLAVINASADRPAVAAAAPAAPVTTPVTTPTTTGAQSGYTTPNPTDIRLSEGMQVPTGASASRVMLGNQQGQDIGIDAVRKFSVGGKTLYSNVESGADNAALMSGKPGMQTVPGASSGASGGPISAMANADPALYAARLAAVNRGDIDAVKASYGGDFNDYGMATKTEGGIIGQLQREMASGKKLTARGAQVMAEAVRAQADAARVVAENRRGDAQSDTAAKRLAMDAQTHSQDAALKSGQVRLLAQTEAARNAVLNAKTPAERLAAEENLTVLLGKQKAETPDLFDRVQTGIDPVTQTPIYSIYSKRTGQVADQPAGKAAPATGITTGATYKGPDGVYPYNGKTITVKDGKITEIK